MLDYFGSENTKKAGGIRYSPCNPLGDMAELSFQRHHDIDFTMEQSSNHVQNQVRPPSPCLHLFLFISLIAKIGTLHANLSRHVQVKHAIRRGQANVRRLQDGEASTKTAS